MAGDDSADADAARHRHEHGRADDRLPLRRLHLARSPQSADPRRRLRRSAGAAVS